MSDIRTLAPLALDTILPLIRTLHGLQERACAREAAAEVGDAGGVTEYAAAAELEERIRQPIVVAGRVLDFTGDENGWRWHTQGLGDTSMQMSVRGDRWGALLVTYADNLGVSISAQGSGPTIAAALSDADARYQAAIADVLLRMGGLLGEVTPITSREERAA